MELDQVNAVHAHSLEGAVNLGLGGRVFAFTGLGGQKEAVAILFHRGAEPVFRLAVPGGGVDVIDAVIQQHLHAAVGFGLRDAGECDRAEENCGAAVAGAAKDSLRNHGRISLQFR